MIDTWFSSPVSLLVSLAHLMLATPVRHFLLHKYSPSFDVWHITELLFDIALTNPFSLPHCPVSSLIHNLLTGLLRIIFIFSVMNLSAILYPEPKSLLPSSSSSATSFQPQASESVQGLTITRCDTNQSWNVSHLLPYDGTEVLSDYEYCLFPGKEDLAIYLSIRRRLTTPLRDKSRTFQRDPDGCCHSDHNRRKNGGYPEEIHQKEGWHTFYQRNRRCPLHGKKDHLAHLNCMLQKTTEQIIKSESDPANSCKPDEAPFTDLWQKVSGLHNAVGHVILQETVIDAKGDTKSLTTLNDLPPHRMVHFLSTILRPFVHSIHQRMHQEKDMSLVGPDTGGNSCLYEECLNQGKWREWVSPAEAVSLLPVTSQICRVHIQTLSSRILTESMELLQKENHPVYLLAKDVQKSIPHRFAKTLISGILSSPEDKHMGQNKTSQHTKRKHSSQHLLTVGREQSTKPFIGMEHQTFYSYGRPTG